MRRTLWVWGFLAGSFVALGAVEAQPGPGAVRVGMGTTLVRRSTAWFEGTEPGGSTSQSTLVAIGPSSLGVDVGVGLGQWIVVGSWLYYANRDHQLEDGIESSSWDLSFLPYVELALFPGETIRPAFALLVGLDADDDYFGYVLGGSVGAHLFATESFSFTPALRVYWSHGSEELETIVDPRTGSADTTEVTISSFSIGLSVTIAGWIGGAAPPP